MIGVHLRGATPCAPAAKCRGGHDAHGARRRRRRRPAAPKRPNPPMLAASASWRYGVWDWGERTRHRDFAF